MTRKYETIATSLLRKVAIIFENKGIQFPISKVLFKQSESGLTWLLVIFDFMKIDNAQLLTDGNLIRHLNLELSPYRLIPVETQYDFIYSILLDRLPSMPSQIELRFSEDDSFQIGRNILSQEIAVKWQELGHVIVAGMTGSGKSVFLRSITNQAVQDGFQLGLIDLEDMTFSELVGCKNLIAPIGGINSAERVLNVVLDMIEERKKIFSSRTSVSDIYDWNNQLREGDRPLPLVLLAIDEFNATIQTFGGTKSDFAAKATQIAWRGRKYGILMVIAGQTFEKVIVGPVRDQMITKICFQVTNASTSRIILGENGAESLDIAGRAITNRWGLIQTYYVGSFDIPEVTTGFFEPIVSEEDAEIIQKAIDGDGKLTFGFLTGLGLSRTEATRLRGRFKNLGIAEVDKNQNNSLIIRETSEITEMLRSRKGVQT